MDRRPPGTGEGLELAAEDDLSRVADAVHESQVTGLGGQCLEQGPQRRDPDPARDEQDLGPRPAGAGQDAYGPSTKTRVPTGTGQATPTSRRAP